ncbi:MAG: hypothetical protein ABFS02_14560 [Pseudomonadota bacterium]
MRTLSLLWWIFIAGMTFGCSDGGKPEGRPVLKEQIEVIEKAKGVEATVLDAAEARRRQIDDDTR